MALVATGEEIIFIGNMGCLTQLQMHLKKLGSGIEVKHTTQILRDAHPLTP